jgi:26S proteasome regulatory subunit N1
LARCHLPHRYEYQRRQTAAATTTDDKAGAAAAASAPAQVDDLLTLVRQIVPFHMANNAEPEAVDLLVEVECLRELQQHCDAANYARTCLYVPTLTSSLLSPPCCSCCSFADRLLSTEV